MSTIKRPWSSMASAILLHHQRPEGRFVWKVFIESSAHLVWHRILIAFTMSVLIDHRLTQPSLASIKTRAGMVQENCCMMASFLLGPTLNLLSGTAQQSSQRYNQVYNQQNRATSFPCNGVSLLHLVNTRYLLMRILSWRLIMLTNITIRVTIRRHSPIGWYGSSS